MPKTQGQITFQSVYLIKSANVERLTSDSLKPLHDLIIRTTAQQKEIREDLAKVSAEKPVSVTSRQPAFYLTPTLSPYENDPLHRRTL